MSNSNYKQVLNGLIDNLDHNYPKKELKKLNDNSIQTICDEIERVGARFPEEAEKDPLYHLLLLKIYSRHYTDYGVMKDLYNNRHFKTLYKDCTVGIPITKSNRNPSIFNNNTNNVVEEYANDIEKFVTKYCKGGKKKKKWIIWGSIVGLVIIAVVVTIFVAPDKVSSLKHKIHYQVDDIQYEVEVVFNKPYTIEVPNKTGYSFLGLYDSESPDAKQVVGKDGNSIGNYDSMFEDKTYYPKFDPKTFIISINPNGGTLTGGVSQTVVYDTKNVKDMQAVFEGCKKIKKFENVEKKVEKGVDK